MSCFCPILATITEGSAYFAFPSLFLSGKHPKKKIEKNIKKKKSHFSKIHWGFPIEEIHIGAFFPDGRITVDCISGVKSAFGEHLEKKSCRPISGPPPKTTIWRSRTGHFGPKVPPWGWAGQSFFFFFQNCLNWLLSPVMMKGAHLCPWKIIRANTMEVSYF